MPVICAVATDESLRAALDHALRHRFASDYDIVVSESCADALRRLNDDGCAAVAMVVAQMHMTDGDGISLLVETNRLHPNARRVLVMDVGDLSAADQIGQALTLGHIDSYFGQPWASPEEEVYPVLGDALRLYARDHLPRFEKAIIIDGADSTRGAQLRGWLERNNVATTFLRAEDARAGDLLAQHGVDRTRLPVAVLYDGTVVVEPSEPELAEALSARTRPPHSRYDLVIVGGGPAGLAAAVYAGSEGVHTLVIEHDSFGGQAGTSAKIRNYLGFPWGLSGAELTERAARQMDQMGADSIVARRVVALRAEGDDRIVTLSNGDEVAARAVVLAGGVRYRRLGVESVDALVSAGVLYGAAPSEAKSMRDLDVCVLGAGNSAGQAAAQLANSGARVTVLVRGDSLAKSMSDYLVRELEGLPNVAVRCNTEVVDAGTADRLRHLVVRDRSSDTTETIPAAALFVFIGAEPHTDWLRGVVTLDDGGFVLTGRDLTECANPTWRYERAPAWLETSMPGVFAAGDIRFGSIKRVAAAVGEGSTAAMLVRGYLSPS